jgi:hypothetical protein
MGLNGRQLEHVSHLTLSLRGGNPESAINRIRRRSQRHILRQALVRQIGPKHVLELNYMRGRLDSTEVQRGYAIDVLEDSRKLSGHRLDLSLGEAQAGQLRNVEYLLSLDHGGRF